MGALWVSHVGRKFSSGSFGLFSHLNSFKYWFLKQSTTLACDVVAQYIMKMQDGNIFKWWFPVAPASASMHLSLAGSVYIFQIFIFLKFQEQWDKHQLHSWCHKHVSEIHITPFLSLFLFLWDMIIDEVIEPQLILT